MALNGCLAAQVNNKFPIYCPKFESAVSFGQCPLKQNPRSIVWRRNCDDKAKKLNVTAKGTGGTGGSSVNSELVELPLFPLPLVLFPGAILPLQIFEYRYRIMMHTLLQTDLRFGVVYTGNQPGTASAVGCVGEVIKYEDLPGGKFFLLCRGQERFRVVDVVRTRPYLVAKVAWLEDRPSSNLPLDDDISEGSHESNEALANEVEGLMREVIRLSNKMSGKESKELPEDLRNSTFPTPFSFWVASTFEGAPSEQQSLLELEDTAERLRRERETLKTTLNYLTAAFAVKDAFPNTTEL